jgi:two-component system, response regulator RegA
VITSDTQTMLIVDDDGDFRERLVRAMRERGFDATGARDYASAIASARQESPELAIVDLRLPDETGMRLVQDLKAIDPSTVIVVLTGYGSIATAVESMRVGAANYLTKPANADQILAALKGAPPAAAVGVPSLARVEWEHIQRVLSDCGGNVSQAARQLNMHRRSLQRKLSKHPVDR